MNLFDFKITHESVEPWPFIFPYHGHNTLSYLLAVYREAFDIVQIMLYESWSSVYHPQRTSRRGRAM